MKNPRLLARLGGAVALLLTPALHAAPDPRLIEGRLINSRIGAIAENARISV